MSENNVRLEVPKVVKPLIAFSLSAAQYRVVHAFLSEEGKSLSRSVKRFVLEQASEAAKAKAGGFSAGEKV